jgi:hypothetical protein
VTPLDYSRTVEAIKWAYFEAGREELILRHVELWMHVGTADPLCVALLRGDAHTHVEPAGPRLRSIAPYAMRGVIPIASMPANAQISSLSDVSPETPTAPAT